MIIDGGRDRVEGFGGRRSIWPKRRAEPGQGLVTAPLGCLYQLCPAAGQTVSTMACCIHRWWSCIALPSISIAGAPISSRQRRHSMMSTSSIAVVGGQTGARDSLLGAFAASGARLADVFGRQSINRSDRAAQRTPSRALASRTAWRPRTSLRRSGPAIAWRAPDPIRTSRRHCRSKVRAAPREGLHDLGTVQEADRRAPTAAADYGGGVASFLGLFPSD